VKVLIMADMEGVSGVTVWEQIGVDEPLYQEGRRLFTEDVNAAVRGAVAAGASKIVVREFHGGKDPFAVNHAIPELLDEHCEWVSHHYGPEQPWLEDFAACVIVGAHAMAGTPDGILCHTITGGWNGVWLNNHPAGETEIFANLLGTFGIPVVLVIGDTAVCKEAEAAVPYVRTLAVKRGFSFNSGQCIAPARARKMIEAATAEALKHVEAKPLVPARPTRFRIEFKDDQSAAVMAQMPNVTMTDPRHIVVEAEDYVTALNRLFGWV
jgi:D-amino peptidase